jgi:hypothetical protein
MSNQLSIQAALSIHSPGDDAAPSRRSAPSAAPAAKPVPLFVNPSFEFDPTVGLVVIDFHNNSGAVTDSIPSQRQLEAYRTHRESPPGEPTVALTPPSSGKTAAG